MAAAKEPQEARMERAGRPEAGVNSAREARLAKGMASEVKSARSHSAVKTVLDAANSTGADGVTPEAEVKSPAEDWAADGAADAAAP